MVEWGRCFRDTEDRSPAAYRSEAAAVIDVLAHSAKTFTAEDVRALAGSPPHHHNAMGAIMSGAQQAGIIRVVGYTKARRPSSHVRILRVYVGNSA